MWRLVMQPKNSVRAKHQATDPFATRKPYITFVTALATYYISESSSGTLVLESYLGVFCPWCSGLASRMLLRGWVVTEMVYIHRSCPKIEHTEPLATKERFSCRRLRNGAIVLPTLLKSSMGKKCHNVSELPHGHGLRIKRHKALDGTNSAKRPQ